MFAANTLLPMFAECFCKMCGMFCYKSILPSASPRKVRRGSWVQGQPATSSVTVSEATALKNKYGDILRKFQLKARKY